MLTKQVESTALMLCVWSALVVTSPALSQSKSMVTQNGRLNTANVTQKNANSTSIEQDGDMNLANSQQLGNGNEASIIQQDVIQNDAGIYQESSGSDATIKQTSGANLSAATINQLSGVVSNSALIEQSGTAFDGPTGIIDQYGGIGNSAIIIQGDTTPYGGIVTSAPNSYADKLQIGNENESLIVQGGSLQWARNNAIGSTNQSQITQGAIGGSENVAFVLQLSDENVSTVAQNGSENHIKLIQESGNGNESVISQGFVASAGTGGDRSSAIVLQQGSENLSIVEQNVLTLGSLNTSIVKQFGIGNQSSIAQDGSGNTANVTQGVGTGAICAPFAGRC